MEKTAKNMEKLTEIASGKFEEMLDRLFEQMHEIAQTRSGDIDPMQVVEMNELSQQMVKLIVAQVWQNL